MFNWLRVLFAPKEAKEMQAKVISEIKSKPALKKATTRSKTMPLVKSAKPAAFKKNIATSVKEGKPVKQAVAIAYSEAREAKKPSKTTKPKRK